MRLLLLLLMSGHSPSLKLLIHSVFDRWNLWSSSGVVLNLHKDLTKKLLTTTQIELIPVTCSEGNEVGWKLTSRTK